MSVIVTDDGFRGDDWETGFATAESWPSEGGALGLDVPSDTDPASLGGKLNAPIIRVDFPSFSDGRGFTIAAELRRMGYGGRLRAKGHVIADQYAMARRAGFDEVEISSDLALRQTEDQWIARADWRAHSYQNRLRG